MIEDYKIFKTYLKIIIANETKLNALNKLMYYLFSNDNKLLHDYCQGDNILPSFMLLKELQKQVTYKLNQPNDLALTLHFQRAIKLAKQFYYNLIKTSYEYIKTNKNFDHYFETNAQPYGVQMIDILVSLKYEIKAIAADSVCLPSDNILSKNKWMSNIYKKLSLFKSRLYALRSVSTHIVDRLYMATILALILSSFLLHHKFDSWANKTYYSFYIDLMLSLVIIIAGISLYPFMNFGTIDIFGSNRVSYQYRKLFNALKRL